jgi:Starch-binding associating with outer membrane
MKNIIKKFSFALILLATACDLDGDLENPNNISVSGADVNLLMNKVQADFGLFYSQASGVTGRLVRLESMTAGDRYATAIRGTTTDGLWTTAYQDVLINSQTLIPLAQAAGLTTHVAVAKILEAYVYITLVDLYGDVPQMEALKGESGNFNPVSDNGQEVYAKAITLLTEAKTELAKTGAEAGAALARDTYYGGNRDRWNALANTLELKAWLNISLISSRTAEANAKIDGLLTSDLIDTEAENFTYKYAGVTVPPSRHPLYDQYYDPIIANAGGYISNWFMYELYQGNGVQDPRWRYYLYRQVGSNAEAFRRDPKNVGCGVIPEHYAAGNFIFCQFEPGFYGRDHGDDSGTNPDSPFITCAGVYPAGGKIDAKPTTNRTFYEPTRQGDGANGAGIQPIFMSFFTDFMKAEYLLRKSNNVADAKTALATAIGNSIAQIRNFATSKGQTLPAGLEPSTSAYQSAVATNYDAAAEKMDVIGREFYMACFGNGIEAYNLYRRTGAPKNMQPTRVINPGVFFHSLVYPSVYVNLNSSAAQKEVDIVNRVFWAPALTLN